MQLIKLNAIGSTNSHLRQLCTKEVLADYTVVFADHQTEGRGHMGTNWSSQKGKNLTCSVYKEIQGLPLDQSFNISMLTSLAIIRTLEHFNVPRLSVKWPNDILSENKKICGILIENISKNGKIEASILGIGLNVNQTSFKNLPKAASLKLILGRLFDREELLNLIVANLNYYFDQLTSGHSKRIKNRYEKLLFRKGKPSTFRDKDGHMFPGYIRGVTDNGYLKVLTEDEILREFDLKDVELLY